MKRIRAVPKPVEPKEETLESPLEPLLEEVHAFCQELVPASHAEDFELAVRLYLETHPVMRERLHVLRAQMQGQSASVPVDRTETADGEAKDSKGGGGGRR